jgi:hypothetical protein
MNPRSLIGTTAFLAFSFGATAAGMEAADFGTPPSGEIPILFNNHTVYAKPDVLKERRVLAALVKNGEIYVPLRAMFEQMGATVSVSADNKTVTAEKPGASVSVTLGRPEVIINGESRPLDVPPILDNGRVLVPVRVISEALGAYVQWVSGRQIVVVRYIPLPEPTAPPTAVPTAPPTAVPTAPPTIAPTLPPAIAPIIVAPPIPTPTPVPAEASYTGFIQGAYSPSNNYNEFVAGGYCVTYILNAAYAPQNSPIALKADFRQDAHITSSNIVDAFGNHYTQFATIDGGTAVTPVFMARQSSFDARVEYKVAAPRVYVGVGYLHTANNYGYPNLNAFGAGIEKLPDLRPGLSLYGSAFYYPTASGNYTETSIGSPNAGIVYQQQYRILKYDIGVALNVAHLPVYLYGGYAGDNYTASKNAPIGQIHNGPYIGLGVKL